MAKQKLIVGIDIGGINTAFGFIQEDSKCFFSSTLTTNPNEDVDIFIERLSNKINTDFRNYSPDYTLSGIGIAAPMANHLNGTIETPSNIKWNNVRFVERINKIFNVPTAIINDANAAALGEYEYGLGKGLKNFIAITLGTGLGCGIIIDGNLHE